MPRIVAVSDLHTHLPVVPACDLLVIAGDVCSIFTPALEQEAYLRGPFAGWLSNAPAGAVVGVSGNHELVPDQLLASLPWHYLTGEALEIEGLRVHGLPWTNRFADSPYQDELGRETRETLPPRFEAVPDGVDVLISHMPPFGLCDEVQSGERVGSRALRWTIERARPTLCVSGHIHRAHGAVRCADTLVVNAALAGEHDDLPAHAPLVIDIAQGHARIAGR